MEDHRITLARMAARLAGLDPDGAAPREPGAMFDFAGPAWKHPKFTAAADSAYAILAGPQAPGEVN